MESDTSRPDRHPLRDLITRRLVEGRSVMELSVFDGCGALWWFVDYEFEGILRGEGRRRRKPRSVGPLTTALYETYQLAAAVASRAYGTPPPPLARGGSMRVLVGTSNLNWRWIFDPEDGALRKGDAFFESVFVRGSRARNAAFLTASPLNGGGDGWYRALPGLEVAAEKRRAASVPFIPFEAVWSPRIGLLGQRARSHFGRLFQAIRAAPALEAALPGAPSIRIKDLLAHYFLNVFPQVVEWIEMGRVLLHRISPDVLLLINEYGRFERALLVAARSRGIPVVAIQHGVIHPSHWAYMLAKDEVRPTAPNDALACPLPDVTAVQGDYYRRLLTQVSSYPPDSVVVTGQPRYDRLADPRLGDSRDRVLKQFGIPETRRIILWTTQSHWLTAEESRRTVSAVARAAAGLPGFEVVAKLHPGEDPTGSALKQAPGWAPKIAGVHADTAVLLRACDLLITKDSTTGLEAAALGKPVIVLNLGGQPDVVDYVVRGIAVGVYDAERLGPAIESLARDPSPLAAKREAYVRDYFGTLDGRATDRVLDLLERAARSRPRA